MKKKIILLTGPKHSGKTSVAQALKKLSGWEASDLDEVLENKTGRTPRELFREGRDIFQKAEAEALESLINPEDKEKDCLIIAAGGGLIDNNEAMALLSSHREVICVYLDVPAETAWQRIVKTANGGELPPFLNTGNPAETHFALHERRANAYKSMAQISIASENMSPEEIAEEIARLFDF